MLSPVLIELLLRLAGKGALRAGVGTLAAVVHLQGRNQRILRTPIFDQLGFRLQGRNQGFLLILSLIDLFELI